MKYIIDRLKEPSTIRGIILLLGLLGIKLSPEQTETITSAGLGLIAAVEVFRKEKVNE